MPQEDSGVREACDAREPLENGRRHRCRVEPAFDRQTLPLEDVAEELMGIDQEPRVGLAQKARLPGNQERRLGRMAE